MRIERLILSGFKSFADRVEIELLPGVTAIIGPNGSGKSNLIEAIRFAASARARKLRSQGHQDLIFQGGADRRAAGFAEVTLEIAGETPVVVRRRVFRDGRQEVTLNGQRTSLKQVALALAGSGLGPGGAAIIGQGEVAQVVEAPPERLRDALVEAAGLSGVRASAEDARVRLEAARERLSALEAALAQKREALSRLRREAEEARRVRALEAERLAVRRGLLGRKKQQAQAAWNRAKEEAERARAKAAALEARARELVEEARLLGVRREALRAQLGQFAEARARLHAQLEGLKAQRSLAEDHQALLERSLAEIEARLSRLPKVPPEPPEDPPPPDDELALRERFKATRNALKKAEADFKRAEARYTAYLRAKDRYEIEFADYQKRRAEAKALDQRLEAARARLAEASEAYAQKSAEAEELAQAIRRLRTSKERLEAEQRALEAEKRRLVAALEEGRGLAEGPRRLLQAGLPGVLGSVAGLLALPPELAPAAEAALGGRLSWIVVEDESALKAALAWLSKNGFRATLLAKTLARPPAIRPVPTSPGIEGRLRDFVQVPGEDTLTRTLLGETLLGRDLDAALALFRASPRRIVTRRGELLEPSGAVSGGRVRKHGVLREKSRLAEVEEKIAATVSALGPLTEELAALERRRPDLTPLRQAVEAIRAEVRYLESQRKRHQPGTPPAPPQPVAAPSREPLQRLEAELAEIMQALEAASRWRAYREASAAYAERPGLLEKKGELEAELAKARSKAGALKDLGDRLSSSLAALLALENQARSALSELTKAKEALKQRATALEREHLDLKAAAENARLVMARQEVIIEAAKSELAALPPGPASPGGQKRLREIEAELAEIGEVNFRAEQALKTLESEVEGRLAEYREAQAATERLEAFLAEVKKEFEDRLAQAERTLGQRFASYTQRLLSGRGELRRENGGLSLLLAPGGKRVRRLGLLSTGEKTMGALALLFALAEVREGGLPIALLDEVDAALDEANLVRFANFLKAFKENRQILLVTHQKRTLEAADAIVGVTSVGGVSRVYTLDRQAPA